MSPPGPYVIDPPPGVGNVWYVLPPGPYVSDPPPGVGNVWYVLFPGPYVIDPPPGVGNTWYVVPPGPYVSDPPPGVGNVWYVLWANASELRAVRRTTKLRYTTILGRISELSFKVEVAGDVTSGGSNGSISHTSSGRMLVGRGTESKEVLLAFGRARRMEQVPWSSSRAYSRRDQRRSLVRSACFMAVTRCYPCTSQASMYAAPYTCEQRLRLTDFGG